MYLRQLRILVVLLGLSISGQIFAADQQCEIQKGPPEKLANYIREMKSLAEDVKKRYKENLCSSGSYQSPLTTYKRSLMTYDKAMGQLPIMNDVVQDFAYNISSLIAINTPTIVFDHGRLLYNLEKNTLLPTLDTLASRCQLDGQAEKEIVALLRINKDMQNYFKGVVAGTTGEAPESDTTKQEIFKYYAPENLISCKDKTDLSSAIQRIQEKIGGFGTDIDTAVKNWKEAIALFQGETTNTKKTYTDKKRELLLAELERQGLSQDAIKKIMRVYNCVQAKTSTQGGNMSWIRAKFACIEQPLIGYENEANTIKEEVKKSKTTDEYIIIDNKTDLRIREESQILQVFGVIRTEAQSMQKEDTTNAAIITSLVNIHIQLLSVTDFINKRIPAMEANCMKGSPAINCYFR